jgi:hypothetical protein
MAKATLREIMKKAHQIAKNLIGDYQARLSYGLKVAWAEYKEGNKMDARGKALQEAVKKLAEQKIDTGIFIPLGKTIWNINSSWRTELNITVEKETEKALQLKVEVQSFKDEKAGQKTEKLEWVPKSQIEIMGDYIATEAWVARNKFIPAYRITCDLSMNELWEKERKILSKLTTKERLELFEKGYASKEWFVAP